jgi:hypothetical protein
MKIALSLGMYSYAQGGPGAAGLPAYRSVGR